MAHLSAPRSRSEIDISKAYYANCFEDFCWFLEHSGDEYDKISDRVASIIDSYRYDEILDVGGGTGLLTQLISSKLSAFKAATIDCIEPQSKAHSHYKDSVSNLRTLFECDWDTFVRARVKRQYDVILACNSMYGVDFEKAKVLSPFRDKLKSDGHSIIVIGNDDSAFVQTPKRFWHEFHGERYSKNTASTLADALDSARIPFLRETLNAEFDIGALNEASIRRFAAFSLYLPSSTETNLEQVIEYISSLAISGKLRLAYDVFTISK